jgi:hypothetical protein
MKLDLWTDSWRLGNKWKLYIPVTSRNALHPNCLDRVQVYTGHVQTFYEGPNSIQNNIQLAIGGKHISLENILIHTSQVWNSIK